MANTQDILLPDVGGEEVEIIEISVEVGDILEEEDAIITVETDKASMDIPAIFSGKLISLNVKLGDKVSQGTLICTMEISETTPEEAKEINNTETNIENDSIKEEIILKDNNHQNNQEIKKENVNISLETNIKNDKHSKSHASPSIRRLAREFGVDLSLVLPSGRKNRIMIEDVKSYVKQTLENIPNNTSQNSDLGFNLPQLKEIDFTQFGEIELQALSKIQKISGPSLHRNWIGIPHVTQFDEANITELEKFRKEQNALLIKSQATYKISPLIFILKAVSKALKIHPIFNSSLSANQESIILKKYINIGVAVDTPNGLVVPVIKDVDKKGINELAQELLAISQKARDGKLKIEDIQGACFTISSLGGIGGTSFTPIVNAPEVAILGVSKSQMKAIWNGEKFIPQLILPLSLSYDHRVIDGAKGAKFSTTVSNILSDIRLLVL